MDDKNKILSYRAIPVNTIREGLRTVELLGPGMEMNANSCLLVEVVKAEEKVKKKMASLFVWVKCPFWEVYFICMWADEMIWWIIYENNNNTK